MELDLDITLTAPSVGLRRKLIASLPPEHSVDAGYIADRIVHEMRRDETALRGNDTLLVQLRNNVPAKAQELAGFFYDTRISGIITGRIEPHPLLWRVHYALDMGRDGLDKLEVESTSVAYTPSTTLIEALKVWQRETLRRILRIMADSLTNMEAQTSLRAALFNVRQFGAVLQGLKAAPQVRHDEMKVGASASRPSIEISHAMIVSLKAQLRSVVRMLSPDAQQFMSQQIMVLDRLLPTPALQAPAAITRAVAEHRALNNPGPRNPVPLSRSAPQRLSAVTGHRVTAPSAHTVSRVRSTSAFLPVTQPKEGLKGVITLRASFFATSSFVASIVAHPVREEKPQAVNNHAAVTGVLTSRNLSAQLIMARVEGGSTIIAVPASPRPDILPSVRVFDERRVAHASVAALALTPHMLADVRGPDAAASAAPIAFYGTAGSAPALAFQHAPSMETRFAENVSTFGPSMGAPSFVQTSAPTFTQDAVILLFPEQGKNVVDPTPVLVTLAPVAADAPLVPPVMRTADDSQSSPDVAEKVVNYVPAPATHNNEVVALPDVVLSEAKLVQDTGAAGHDVVVTDGPIKLGDREFVAVQPVVDAIHDFKVIEDDASRPRLRIDDEGRDTTRSENSSPFLDVVEDDRERGKPVSYGFETSLLLKEGEKSDGEEWRRDHVGAVGQGTGEIILFRPDGEENGEKKRDVIFTPPVNLPDRDERRDYTELEIASSTKKVPPSSTSNPLQDVFQSTQGQIGKDNANDNRPSIFPTGPSAAEAKKRFKVGGVSLVARSPLDDMMGYADEEPTRTLDLSLIKLPALDKMACGI
jgi:hypothetical protein